MISSSIITLVGFIILGLSGMGIIIEKAHPRVASILFILSVSILMFLLGNMFLLGI